MPVARLITELAESGREATDAEIRRLREHVAERGFDPDARERVRGRGAGIVWRGRKLRGSDRLPPAEAHYVRHVLGRPEWPEGTTLDDYLQSISSTVTDEAGGVLMSMYQGNLQVGFVARSGKSQGIEGGGWILVEFRHELDHVTTAHQVPTPESVLVQERRINSRWLKSPTS